MRLLSTSVLVLVFFWGTNFIRKTSRKKTKLLLMSFPLVPPPRVHRIISIKLISAGGRSRLQLTKRCLHLTSPRRIGVPAPIPIPYTMPQVHSRGCTLCGCGSHKYDVWNNAGGTLLSAHRNK